METGDCNAWYGLEEISLSHSICEHKMEEKSSQYAHAEEPPASVCQKTNLSYLLLENRILTNSQRL